MILRSRRFRWGVAAAGAVATLAVVAPAFALLVQPIVLRMQSTGPRSSAAITVVNDRNTPDTIELTVSKLTLPQRGPPVLTPDKGDDFLIFPPIATIQPGKTQVFRVRWVGQPVLPEARSYMFTTSEVPAEAKPGSGVQLVYAIQSLVTVSSAALKSDINILSVARGVHDFAATDTTPARSEPGLNVSFSNDSDDVVYLSDYQMKFEAPGKPAWTKTVDSHEVSALVGLGLVTPHSKRDLFLSLPDLPPTGDVRVSLKREAPK